MKSCRECGSALRPSQSRMRVFSMTERSAPMNVPADECPLCGRLSPAEGAIEVAQAQRAAVTVRPVSAARVKLTA
jgi:hypothetical protein